MNATNEVMCFTKWRCEGASNRITKGAVALLRTTDAVLFGEIFYPYC